MYLKADEMHSFLLH